MINAWLVKIAWTMTEPLAPPRSANTVRLEMALLGHLFTTAIKEWGIGLTYNPVMNVRRPSPGAGRNRRLSQDEEKRLLNAIDEHSNPMLGWIVRIAVETGMRSSEINSLTLGQVNLQKRIVTLLETKNAMPRTVPLTLEAVEQFQQATNNPVRPPDTNLVFFGEPGRDGTRKPYTFNKIWMQIKENDALFKGLEQQQENLQADARQLQRLQSAA